MLTVNTDYHWPVPNLWVIGYKSQNVKNLRVYSYCMRFAQYQYIVTLAFLLYCFLQTRDRIRIIGYSLTYGHTRFYAFRTSPEQQISDATRRDARARARHSERQNPVCYLSA
jgi:hypothetical protein